MGDPTAYPLQWPFGRPRTKSRVYGRFTSALETTSIGPRLAPITMAIARERLERELDALGARMPILSTNIELTLRGQPRSGRSDPSDPGVALYFQLKGKPMAMACDRYTQVAQNIAAIAGHIEATRRIDRYGVATTEEMFAGFLALPAPMVINDWRTTLDNPQSLAAAEATYREKMKVAHPDLPTGSQAAASALNAAIEMARKELR